MLKWFCRKVNLERMLRVGRISDLKWRLNTFFVVPFITRDTVIIACTDLIAFAKTAIHVWISFFIVAPKQREYDMII